MGGCLAVDVENGLGERDAFWTYADTVLGFTATLNAALFHESVETRGGVHGSCGVGVEQANLGNGGRTYEVTVVIDLGAGFEAAAAGHAFAELIHFFADFFGHARTFAKVVGAVNGDPSFDAFEVVKHGLSVHDEIADDGKLFERFENDGVGKFIHEGRTCLARHPVDVHGAGTADFFQAGGIPRTGRYFFAVGGIWFTANFKQYRNHVHIGTIGHLVGFPIGSAFRGVLSQNTYVNMLAGRSIHCIGLGIRIRSSGCHKPVSVLSEIRLFVSFQVVF